MPDVPPKIKAIIMDKAPAGNSLAMSTELGFTTPDLSTLADAFNQAFGTTIAGTQLEPLATVDDVVNFVVSQIP